MVTQSKRRRVLRRNLASICLDGFSFSVMVGIGETYLPAFVLARGLGELTAGLITTVPLLLGSVLQLVTPLILQRIGSYRRFVVVMASVQAASLLVLAWMALAEQVAAWAVFVPATLYWAAGLSTGPAWNTWVEELVPRRIRPGFFARRSRLCHVGVLLGLISGGLLLRWAGTAGVPTGIFAVLFSVGALGRFVSAAMLGRQTETRRRAEVPEAHAASDRVPVSERWQNVRQALLHPGSAARLVLFLMAVQTAVYISGPYFNPFMLRVLKLSWMEYMGLLSLGFIGKMLSLPWAGRLATRAGADRLLILGSLGIVPISALWMIRQDVWFLACCQLLSGLMWGCYELAMLLQFFRQLPPERRVGILTLYNLGNSAAMVVGSVIGALILTSLGKTATAYLTVFVASSVGRLAAIALLPGRQGAVQSTGRVVRRIFSRTIAVRPMAGSLERPVFASLDSDPEVAQIPQKPVRRNNSRRELAHSDSHHGAGLPL